MEEQLGTLIQEFTAVKENINSVNTNISSIKTKLDKLRNVYSKMISANSHKKIFLFCLESFNFQIKTFSVDSENLHKSLLLVSNRVFCDYYKLFRLIKILFDDYGYQFPKEIGNLYATCDILNPFFEYTIPDIDKIHKDVCLLINALIEYYNDNCNKIVNYTSKSQSGISIFNFIKTLEYDNSVLKDQIILYLNYMDFFKITQTKYLAKLVGKTNSLKKEIDSEIVDDLDPPEPLALNVIAEESIVPVETPNVPTEESIVPVETPNVPTEESIVPVETPNVPTEESNVLEDPTNPPNTPVVSIASDDEEDGPYLELTSPTCMSDAASETSLADSQISKCSSTEKKNEISAPENLGGKTAKKKGRPKTKNGAKTKNGKKDEATETDVFGLTIDQIEEHVSMTIAEQ